MKKLDCPIGVFLERIRKLSPIVASKIKKPLSEREISRQAGTLPKPLVDLFRLANGQAGTRVGLLPLLHSQDALSLLNFADSVVISEGIGGSEVLYHGTSRRRYDIDSRIKDCFWNPQWHLVAERRQEGLGLVTRLFVDFDPSELGIPGQVVREDWSFGGSQEIVARVVLADSLELYFEELSKLPIFFDEKVGVRIGYSPSNATIAPGPADPVRLSDAILSKAGEVLDRWGEATPASSQEIDRAERILKTRFPEDIVRLFRVSREWHWNEPRFDSIWLLSPIEAANESIKPVRSDDRIEVEVAINEGVKPYYYGISRFTIAQSDYYRFQLDMDPDSGGIVGQVVLVDIESGEIGVFEGSLNAFVHRGLSKIEEALSK